MQAFFWFLTWLVLFGGWSTPVIPIASVSAPPAIQEVALGEPFLLPYSATATADGGSLWITFAQIVEDSRCPADVMCAWSGQAVVALQVAAGDETQTVELGGFTDNKGVLRPQRPELETTSKVEVAGYTLELLAVTPYPAKAGQPAAAEAYQVQLRVSLSEP
jgi:hypothetical protein